jgi:LysR family transcriptional regulator, transcriptional activator for leuABCD operon
MFNLRNLDLNLLTVFEAIYEAGTVSGAADRLGLSQSAASHALARLREACENELFVRGRRGLSATATAEAMYPVIKQALQALRASLAEAASFDPGRSQRRFRISIPHPLGPFYALELQAAISAKAPDIALMFDTVSRPIDLEDNIRDGVVDIAIDWLPFKVDSFVNKKLFDDRLVLLARRDHPTIGEKATIEDLRKERFISLHHRRADEQAPQPIREFLKLQMRVVVHVSELLEIPTVVASTDLLGLFAASMGPLLTRRLALQILPIPGALPALPIYMIWHETRRRDAAHRWLRELVVAELNRIADV